MGLTNIVLYVHISVQKKQFPICLHFAHSAKTARRQEEALTIIITFVNDFPPSHRPRPPTKENREATRFCKVKMYFWTY